ncbi:MAG TPA: hypothetical protein VFT78_13515 [Hanamia sp.]|nr:hypothetical protein [Hanamia sp.]
MNKSQRVQELENEISEVRYQLILKGSQLRFLKGDTERITRLTNEVQELRKQLYNLNEEIIKYKFAYFVTYEVSTRNIYTNQVEHDTFSETLLLDQDFDVDLPKENDDWNWDKKGISAFVLAP